MFPNNLGWNSSLENFCTDSAFADHKLGRVTRVDRGSLNLETEFGSLRGTPVGRLMQLPEEKRPAVGDWVFWTPLDAREAVVLELLPRINQLTRAAAGTTSKVQVLVANLDLAVIAMSADGDFSLSRLERYLIMVRGAGIQPAIVLTRCDVCCDVPALEASIREISQDAPILATSSFTGLGFETLSSWFSSGTTAVILGSSGVGKSTIVNKLLGSETQSTGAIRISDGLGKHTTTSRDLLCLPQGGVIIDTPGLREVLPLADADTINETFAEIEHLSSLCRFRDCGHQNEPGCAVVAAVEAGDLQPRRLANFLRLHEESSHAVTRASDRLSKAGRDKDRNFGKMSKQAQAFKKKNRN